MMRHEHCAVTQSHALLELWRASGLLRAAALLRIGEMIEYERALGASLPAGTIQITLFVPSVTRDGEPLDQTTWREEVLTAFGQLFRGATAFPPGRGVWRDDGNDGRLVFDDTVLVTTYAAERDVTEDTMKRLRTFLHRLGRETRQGEIGVVIDANYFGITEYDE